MSSGVRLEKLRFGVIDKKVGVFECGLRSGDLKNRDSSYFLM
jgi:hypothetical protein